MAKHLVMPVQPAGTSAMVGEAGIGFIATVPPKKCPRSRCGQALLPPGWDHKWCPGCVDQHREASMKGRMDRRVSIGAIRDQIKAAASATAPKTSATSQCYFCSVPILIPPGHSSGPLVCESCFKRAIAAKEKQALQQTQQPSVPPAPVRASVPAPMYRPPPILPQVPTLPPSYTRLNLAGPSSLVVPSQAGPSYPPFGGHTLVRPRVTEPPPISQEEDVWEVPSTRITLSTSFDGRPGPGDQKPVDVAPRTELSQRPPAPEEKSADLPNESKTNSGGPDVDPNVDPPDVIDELELEYPDEDPAEPSPIDEHAELSGLPAIADEDHPMVDAPSNPEGSTSSDLQSIFDLPDGWDSEVSDLTDLSNSGESEVDPELQRRSSQKTGLKIRIRIPPGFRMPKPRICAIKTCDQVLEIGYRWKLCEPCRTRFREYTRKRLNVQNPRKDLDAQAHPDAERAGVQTQTQIMPDAAFHARARHAYADADEPLPDGARVCTRRSCHKRLPPLAEYKYKMCNRCRQRSRFNKNRRYAMALLLEKPDDNGVKKNGGLSRHIIATYERQQAKRCAEGFQALEWGYEGTDKGKGKERAVSPVVDEAATSQDVKPPNEEGPVPMDIDSPLPSEPTKFAVDPSSQRPRPRIPRYPRTLLHPPLLPHLLPQRPDRTHAAQAPDADAGAGLPAASADGAHPVRVRGRVLGRRRPRRCAREQLLRAARAGGCTAAGGDAQDDVQMALWYRVLGTPGMDGDEMVVRLRCMQTFALPVGRERPPVSREPEGWKPSVGSSEDVVKPLEAAAESSNVAVGSSTAPVESSTVPAKPSEPPAESSKMPVESSTAPTELLEEPAESTKAPAESSRVSPEPSKVPVESLDAPAGPEQKPQPEPQKEAQQPEQKQLQGMPSVILRNMAGELELRISEDTSPDTPLRGLKTVARFRLVG
ncbi:hypothetical protein EVG20_g8643 [Dentipellis fragilis]|uniref:Uncharacterized protein n=1 Tax=Dentipellis fragilis TaxID=205917 RepID=A0A4Y9Y3W7_9AGAM|nr:hypothetical protein EVG20_g8643 [Dentipellis fragilis]